MSHAARLVAVAVLLVSILWPTTARAAARNVVVVGGGPTFRDAVTVALTPWSLVVVPVETAPPEPVMPRAGREARSIAQRYGAAGVVWLTASEDEHALWVYDGATGQVVTRVMDVGPPFDAPSAAAAALSVKTLLRASTVAPPGERLGAEAAPPASGAVPADEPPGPAPPERADAPARLEAPPGARGPVQIEVGGAARAIADDVDARIGLGASLWMGPSSRVGVGLVARGGPGLGVSAERFRGRFDELSVSPSLRVSVPLSSTVGLEPRVGTTLHVTRIDGVTLETAQAARESRLDASIDGGAVLDVAVSRSTRVGLDVELGYVLRYQRYLVSNAPVFELGPVQASVGLRLATGLP